MVEKMQNVANWHFSMENPKNALVFQASLGKGGTLCINIDIKTFYGIPKRQGLPISYP